MQTEEIITTLLAAAAFLKKPVQDVAGQSIRDLYEVIKSHLRNKFGTDSSAAKVMDLATEKPESMLRKAVLLEESVSANLPADSELLRLVEQLALRLPKTGEKAGQSVGVAGNRNRVQVAGGDIITAERHVQRHVIKPGENHLKLEQRRQLAPLISQVADRLAGEDGRPRFGAVYAMLQKRFGVASYHLLTEAQFEEARKFLLQQRAIHRSHLRHRNPDAYTGDFFRIIHAERTRLGWDQPKLCQFAMATLGLKRPIRSLTALGSIQLKSLATALKREPAGAAVGEPAVA